MNHNIMLFINFLNIRTLTFKHNRSHKIRSYIILFTSKTLRIAYYRNFKIHLLSGIQVLRYQPQVSRFTGSNVQQEKKRCWCRGDSLLERSFLSYIYVLKKNRHKYCRVPTEVKSNRISLATLVWFSLPNIYIYTLYQLTATPTRCN